MTLLAETFLTDEQRAALDAHDRSVSLAAGAGCGKTHVLTERFLSYLDPRVLEPTAELTELVAITFTDAAAREMRHRIRRRSYQRLEKATSVDERRAWWKLIRAMDQNRVSTIHSFCAALLRTHAAEAGLDPRFEVLDGPAAELLRVQTLDDRLRQLLTVGDPRLIELATRFDLRNLRDDLVHLLGENTAQVIQQWGESIVPDVVTTWRTYYEETVVPRATSRLLLAEPVVELCRLCEEAQVSSEHLSAHLQEILQILNSTPQVDLRGEPLRRLSELAKVKGVCRKKDWQDAADYEKYRDACQAVRKLAGRSILRYVLSEEQLFDAASVGLELLGLVADVAGCHEAVKQERNLLEFDDVLIRTLQLLEDPRYPSVRESLGASVRLLMVDEFQDTDPLQCSIVQALCGADWATQGLFVVGDFKQSIYRFRGAQPQVSRELRARLPVGGRLSLTTNFRSQPALLDFVNALFHDAFEEAYEPLVANRPQETPCPAVEFLWAAGKEDGADDPVASRLGPTQQVRVREARFIARRLAALLDGGEPLVVDPESQQRRALRLGDIAILLRSLSDVYIYEEALREYGLDYYLAGGHAFYAQQEIYDILHLLRAIASPADNLSLAGALRSPLFSLEDETLFWLVSGHSSLQEGVFSTERAAQMSASERAKVERAAETIRHLRAQKDQMLVAELLSEAIARTGYDATLLCEFLGRRKLANVEKLVEQARMLDRTSPGDLDGFITQLSEFVVRAPKEPLAASREQSDVIRIMTIHYAKGLEFPLVVVPDLNRKAPPTPHRPVLDPHLGPLVPAASRADSDRYCVGWDMFQFSELEEELEERKRVLYVACTRAADYLMLSSGVKDLQKDLQHPSSHWLKFLSEKFHLLEGRYLGELPEGFGQPQVLVTSTEPPALRKSAAKSRGVDLAQLAEQTRSLAAEGQGSVPASVTPISVDTAARKRFSFSRLSGKLVLENGLATRPSDESNDGATDASGLDPKGLGNLVHAVLEQIDFGSTGDVRGLCDFLAPQYLETQWQEAAASAAKMVQDFLASDRASAMASARVLRREVEFVMPWPLQSSLQEGRYLHGVIDCLYQDAAGSWHVVDYKSNQVSAGGVPVAAERYALQIFAYSLACEAALGVAPVESILYFLRPGAEFDFSWDAAQRSTMATAVDQAIHGQLGVMQ
ncbi:MAG: UvrD-helicase domain-containing protein [Pirellulales bacterium]|nr:UvrD-helicase domain-containing protein [Pirellulales bacterium]